MPIKTYPFDPAQHMKDDEDVAAFIEAVLEDPDPAVIADTVGIVARALGMSEIARETGVPRESIFRALSGEDDPERGTLVQVLQALESRLSVKAA